MKKLIPLILFFILTGFVYAEEKIAVTTKSGITYHWDNYFERDNNYCTLKSYGELCVQKSNTASVIRGEEEKLPPVKKVNLNDPRVIQRNKKWQEEYEATVFARQLEELGEEKKKYEQEKLRGDILFKSIELEGQLNAERAKDIKKAKRRTENRNNAGAINVTTGEYLAPAGSGYVGTRDGTYYAPAGSHGIIDTRTGTFIPTN